MRHQIKKTLCLLAGIISLASCQNAGNGSSSSVKPSDTSTENTGNSLKLLSFNDVSKKNEDTMKNSIKKTANILDENSLVKTEDSNVSVEAIVQNEQKDSFLNMVLYVSYLDTKIAISQGNDQYHCSSTTVYDDGMWITKIDFDLCLSFNSDNYCYIEVKEITFLHNGTDRKEADLNSKEVSTLEYGYVGVPVTIDGLKYRYINNHELEVIGVEDEGITSVMIPRELSITNFNGTSSAKVASIGSEAFSNCHSLMSISIPDSITAIHEFVFNGCQSLNRVDITDIAKWCKIDFYSFGKNDYSSNPLHFAHNLYLNGSLVTAADLTGATEIKSFAFHGCHSLTNVFIPDSVTSIGFGAFYGCDSLTDVTLPSNITSLDENVFAGCTSLTNVVIPDSISVISSGLFAGCTSLTKITLPESIISVEDAAFSCCTSLTNVTIPNSVTSIGFSAFSSCTSLSSITLPDTVSDIYGNAFAGCTSLTNVVIPDSISVIPFELFKCCTSLTKITLPETILSVGDEAFSNCTSLNNVIIPNSVTSIGFSAFSFCTSLTDITIGSGITTIGFQTFYGCDNLTNVTFTGTKAQWNKISFGSQWRTRCPFAYIHCSDGDLVA